MSPTPGFNPYAPDLSRRRRQFPKQSNPAMWLLPLLAFGLMVAAVLRLLPDLSRPRAAFAPAYVAVHEKAIRRLPEAPALPSLVADAETVAVHLRLTPGAATRSVAAGAALADARKSTAYFEHQLQLVLRLRGAPAPVSLFQERIGTRNLDPYRRRELDGERYFISSAAAPKTPPDTVMLWTEGPMLFTLVGRAPEDTLVAFAHRLLAAR